MYDFKLDEVARWIVEKGARVVALQMPEGLKVYAQSLVAELEARTSAIFLVIADPCYGACDASTTFASHADVLVHFGHAEIPAIQYSDRILFVEVGADVDYRDLLSEVLPMLKEKVGLVTTVQHIGDVPRIKTWLQESGREVFIGRGDERVRHEGQVLGCNITAAAAVAGSVDQFLFIGSGDFHPLAVSIETRKPVIALDPMTKQIREMSDLTERILRQRHGAITRAAGAKRFLILVATKLGQSRMDLALRLRQMAIGKGRKADLVLMDEFTPDSLVPFEADAYVSTACPRLAIDDFMRYPKPILT
ncbi:MAG: diphthamide biosynthesis enzyme Dph2, partial [Euryarchaeota archaeon]|nr:diphthamide biosynthesis enzyme Dph2 [Euryarchaeota archaeon]